MRYRGLENALKSKDKITKLEIHYRAEQSYEFIADFQQVSEIAFYNFPASRFPQAVLHLPRLKSLSLVMGLEEIPCLIFQMTWLKKLVIQHLPLQTLPVKIKKLSALEELRLNYTYLRELPEDICTLHQLQILHLENNQLNFIPEPIDQLPVLRRLLLANNRLECLPERIALTKLEKLSLHGNPLMDHLGTERQKIVKLLRQFERTQLPPSQRKLYFQQFLGNRAKVQQLARHEEILQGLNSLHALVRWHSSQYLYEHEASPFCTDHAHRQPKMCLWIIGRIHQMRRDEIRKKLSSRDIQVSKRYHEQVTHIIVGEYPKTQLLKAMATKCPLVSQGHLLNFLQKIEPPYLHQADLETEKKAKKVARLLNHGELANQQLGLKMAWGGGIHPAYFYDILMLYLWNPDQQVKKQAEKVLAKHLPYYHFLHLKMHEKAYDDQASEASLHIYLSQICNDFFEADRLGIHFYRRFGKAKRFCLKYPHAFVEVCRDLQVNNVLNLTQQALCVLPDQISQLEQLKTIYLTENALVDLPKGLSNLTRLKALYLQKNRFETFPEIILDLAHLKMLSLAQNYLRHIPEEIRNLQELESLNLADNALTQLPEGISNLQKLRYLDLTNNPIARDRERIRNLRQKLPRCKIVLDEKGNQI